MIFYFMVMVALMCVFLGMGIWKLVSGQWEIGRKSDPVPSRPRPKAVPPFPFGTISDLIRDAERQAEEDFYAQFPEERPKPDTGSSLGGYAMDSSPQGIIVSNGVMTPNEWREPAQNMTHGQVMVLPDGTEYHSLNPSPSGSGLLSTGGPPKMADVGTVDKPYRRYIQGIGIVTADSEWGLTRACEVVIMEKLREHEAVMRQIDNQIKNSQGIPQSAIYERRIREKRYEAWEKCKMYLGLLQELNQ